MSLTKRTYSVLVVSSSVKISDAMTDLLPESDYYPVSKVKDINTAKRALTERDFDLVIVNSPLPDDTGLRFSIDAAAASGTVVLLLAGIELYEDVHERAAEHGIFMLRKPTSKSYLALALDWMASARERLKKTEKKTLTIEEKMNEIRLVNRAKWLLISEVKMDEPSAHRYIEKQAMDRCISKREVAEEIIKTYA
ncbi:MAG: ANTAR domain-containing protein [Clostridia bacterium]|nr:ANTAR domain-containing protein [Clostridia bacterium]